jgi:hypothetical protein
MQLHDIRKNIKLKKKNMNTAKNTPTSLTNVEANEKEVRDKIIK